MTLYQEGWLRFPILPPGRLVYRSFYIQRPYTTAIPLYIAHDYSTPTPPSRISPTGNNANELNVNREYSGLLALSPFQSWPLIHKAFIAV